MEEIRAMLQQRSLGRILVAVLSMLVLMACELEPETTGKQKSTAAIYIASGTPYAGLGITPSAGSNIVTKFDLEGNFSELLRDYGASSGDTPAGILNYDENNILVLVENTASRRVELVKKDGSGYSVLFASTLLGGVLRGMVLDDLGGLLISESSGVEKFTSNGVRITIGANSYIQAPGVGCATMTNNISAMAIAPDGKIIIANAFTAASANNKIAIISKTGYATTADCLATLAAPTTGHFPTAMLMHSSGKLLIAYGNSTGPVHDIYSVSISGASFGTPVLAYSNINVLQGVSRMAEASDGSVLISAASPTFNTLERFTFDSSTGKLTHDKTLVKPGIFSRAISGIMVTP